MIQTHHLLAALFATAVAASAHAFPDKPVTIVVPFAAGGPTDKSARDLAEVLRKAFNNQTVVVENVGGAGGTLGANKVAKASPDGHTLLLHHIGMATAPALYRKLPYDTLGDFEYLGMVSDVPMTLIGRPSLPAGNFTELRKWMADNKGKINLANAGLGAASHLCGLLFQQAMAVDMTTVPYKGTAPAMNDLLGGQVDLMCDQTTNTTGQIKGGKIKAYAVTTPTRVASLPDVPTLQQSGVTGADVGVWHGLYAPKGTPKAAVDKLAAALQVALADPTVKVRFAELGTEPVPAAQATPDALGKHLKSQIDLWAPIIKKAGVYAD